MNPSVKGLSGGRKQMYLRVHRKEVMRFYQEHGPDATMSEYSMTQDTLGNFLNAESPAYETMTPSQRAIYMARMSLDSNRELGARIEELEQFKDSMLPLVMLCSAAAEFIRMMPDTGKVLEMGEKQQERLPWRS